MSGLLDGDPISIEPPTCPEVHTVKGLEFKV